MVQDGGVIGAGVVYVQAGEWTTIRTDDMVYTRTEATQCQTPISAEAACTALVEDSMMSMQN